MKILLSWLNDYIDAGMDAEKVSEVLSDLGFSCEGIDYLDGDAVIDIEVTSNRGDCLGYIGVARELAAAMGKELKMPVVELVESGKDSSELVSVEIAVPDLCCRYTARVIEGVKVGASVDWVRKRLEAIGLRSVNNVVDATNYAMIETGQPPHAFDYDKIAGGKIIVRKAVAGEQLVSIDGTKCDLEPEMLIIADGDGPVAMAGVMGGLESEVSEKTVNILLEDAYFDPVSVRTTSRRLGLPSEAAFRFERNVDEEQIDFASKRTAQLIVETAGGKVAAGVVDCYPRQPEKREVSLRLGRLKKLLGIDVGGDEAMRILEELCFEPRLEDNTIVCIVPSWRKDVYREADLIEEVIRVYGYDNIPTGRKIEIEVVPVDGRQKMSEMAGEYLNGCGFYETINVTFVDKKVAEIFSVDQEKEHLGVKDVSRKNANLLRQSLIGSLLGVLRTNVNAKNTPCKLFELSDTFVPSGDVNSLPVEKMKLTLVSDGKLPELRGVVEGLVGRINKTVVVDFEPCQLGWAEVGAEILADGKVIGTAGIVGEQARKMFDLKEVVPVAAEVDFEVFMGMQSDEIKMKPIARYPAIERDLSVIVDEAVSWAEVCSAVKEKTTRELEEIKYVGIYRGRGIEGGKKSLTLSLIFRDEDGTMTHEQVDEFESNIVGRLTKSVGAELRTV